MSDTPVKKKKKNNKWLSFLIWVAVIIVVIFLTLFLAARIGQFESIRAMIDWIVSQF